MEINKTHNGTDVNNPKEHGHPSHSHIEMHPDFFHTLRFGENTPHYVKEVVPSDKNYNFRCSHRINSYTLKAPLGQNVELHKDYYLVPKQSILPFNAERIIEAPKTGDDVPENANTVVRNFWNRIISAYNKEGTDTLSVLNLFRRLYFVQVFFSRGSLLNYLGYSPIRPLFSLSVIEEDSHPNFGFDDTGEVDTVVDSFLSYIIGDFSESNIKYQGIVVTLSDGTCLTYIVGDQGTDFYSPRDAYNYIFSHIDEVSRIQFVYQQSLNDDPVLVDTLSDLVTGLRINSQSETLPFNYERLCAYALVNAHFYTNDNVDYVYNADMLRNYVSYLVNVISNGNKRYTWNGLNLEYDYFSGAYFEDVLVRMNTLSVDSETIFSEDLDGCAEVWSYISLLFSFRNSLRFVDYFTGARTRPIAVGDIGAAVNDNLVSAVDMARQMQKARYLNSVNRASRNIDKYEEAIFGVSPGYDYHNPMWLASTSDVIYTAEVENTADAQYDKPVSVTAAFKSNAERYAFSVNSDVYGVIVGIEYCDIKRVYTGIRERSFFVKNRYDMFIPQMQFIGDQPIFKQELGVDTDIDSPSGYFGYTTRDMQYKVAISRAVGGFDGDLPGWAFVMKANLLENSTPVVISPEFIRARPGEFDEFYNLLTHYDLRSYFHFIVFQTNDENIDRPMIMNPQILG